MRLRAGVLVGWLTLCLGCPGIPATFAPGITRQSTGALAVGAQATLRLAYLEVAPCFPASNLDRTLGCPHAPTYHVTLRLTEVVSSAPEVVAVTPVDCPTAEFRGCFNAHALREGTATITARGVNDANADFSGTIDLRVLAPDHLELVVTHACDEPQALTLVPTGANFWVVPQATRGLEPTDLSGLALEVLDAGSSAYDPDGGTFTASSTRGTSGITAKVGSLFGTTTVRAFTPDEVVAAFEFLQPDGGLASDGGTHYGSWERVALGLRLEVDRVHACRAGPYTTTLTNETPQSCRLTAPQGTDDPEPEFTVSSAGLTSGQPEHCRLTSRTSVDGGVGTTATLDLVFEPR